MFRKRSRFWIIPALALCTALATTSWGHANESVAEFNIPPQSLDSALLVFAEQADVQVSVSTVVITGMRTQGVVGQFTPSVALTRLLTATGLGFSTVGDRTYSVSIVGNSKKTTTGMLDANYGSNWAEEVMRLAQVPADSNQTEVATRQSADTEPANSRPRLVIEEVVVTGTHIRGVQPAGSNVITIDREQIDKSGFPTVAEVLRSLPQNFGGGPSEDTRSGKEASANGARSTALNLRGLGAGATLVLVNGRRMAPGGVDGSFTDVSSIPLTAIERIDVLPDGASAIYGSEAVGGVVNFILRRDYDGAETQVRFGSVTAGSLKERQVGQALGTHWTNGHALLSYEYYDRDSLPARERALTSNSDLRPFGGSNFGTNQNNPGTIVVGTRTWAIPLGQDGTSLTAGDLAEGTANTSNLNEGRDLLAHQQRHSAFVAASQKVGASVEIFAEGLFTDREVDARNTGFPTTLTVPSSNAFYVNPAGGTGPIRIAYNFIDDLGPRLLNVDVQTHNAALGGTIDTGNEWRVVAYGGYAQEDVEQLQDTLNSAALNSALADPNRATAFNPFGDGSFTNPATLALLRARTLFTSDSELRMANLTAEGAVLSLPGGPVRLALGTDYRRQSFNSVNRTPTAISQGAFDRDVFAAFGELSVPLVSVDNALRGVKQLQLSLAARYEDYSDFGDTTTPKVGLVWRPVQGLALRGTWSNSFKAPNLADLDETATFNFIITLQDPLSPSGTSPVLVRQGNNADLQEETATSWAVGAEISPPFAPGLKLDVNYFDVDFEDRINNFALTQTILREPRFATLVSRNPTSAERDAVCARGTFRGANPDDCRNLPISAILDLRNNNTAITNTRGLDLLATYRIDNGTGTFNFGLNASYLLEFSQAQVRSSPLFDVVDTTGNPIDLRMRGSISWDLRGFGTTAFVNYADSYTDSASIPNRPVASWTTLDLQLAYHVDARSQSFLKDTTFSINAQNVFDEEPPFVNNPEGVGYDRENADLLGRFVSFQFRKNW